MPLTDDELTALFAACLADEAITKPRNAFHNAKIELAHRLGEGAIDVPTYRASVKRLNALYNHL